MKTLVGRLHEIIATTLVVGIIIVCSLLYPQLYERTWMAIQDLGNSFLWYISIFVKGFGVDWQLESRVVQSTYIEGLSFNFLPSDWESFGFQLGIVFKQLFSSSFAIRWWKGVTDDLYLFAEFVLMILPLGLLIIFGFNKYFSDHEEAVGVETKPLTVWKKTTSFVKEKIINRIIDFFKFFRNKKRHWIPFVIEVLFFTNGLNILISALAFYLYFIGSMDMGSIWIQIVRFMCDLSHTFRKEFIPLWILFFIWLFRTIFRKIAVARKDSCLNRCNSFVKEDLGISTLLNGVMGSGKTTMMSDLAITTEEVMMDMALSKMIELSSFFPDYDFRKFEVWFDNNKNFSWNLSQVSKFLNHNLDHDCFYEKSVSLGCEILTLHDVLYKYGRLYWVYSLKSSLIYGNYSIRSGMFEGNDKHLVCHLTDFDGMTSESYQASNFAHILPFDSLRTGKKMNDKGRFVNAVDIGVFTVDEIGKERKNQVELEDIKKGDEETNQKNDGFNYSIKMARHPSTIDNYPFVKFFGADQRLGSVPADLKELNDTIINISKKPETKNLYPLYFLFDWVLTLLDDFFVKLWTRYRFNRDENSLLFHFIKKGLQFTKSSKRIFFNLYGVKYVEIDFLDSDGNVIDKGTYPLVASKIYMRRFATDAYADFYSSKGLKSNDGIETVSCYANEKASINELKQQDSYFISDLTNKVSEKKKNVKKGETYGNGKRRYY